MSDGEPSVYVGARSPEALRVSICSGTSGLDMTTVQSVVFQICRGRDWSAVIDSATRSKLVAVHTFDANGQETRTPATLRVFAILNLAGGGVRRAGPFNFTIKP